MIFFLSFILSLCTTIQPKNSVLINLLFLFVHDHSANLGVTLTLLFIIFLDVPIFWFIIFIAVLPISFVHHIHWRAALILRTLYPWVYEVLAAFLYFLRYSKFSPAFTRISIKSPAITRILFDGNEIAQTNLLARRKQKYWSWIYPNLI